MLGKMRQCVFLPLLLSTTLTAAAFPGARLSRRASLVASTSLMLPTPVNAALDSGSAAVTQLHDGLIVLDDVISRWKDLTIDCNYGEIRRELLESANKEALLNAATQTSKAATMVTVCESASGPRAMKMSNELTLLCPPGAHTQVSQRVGWYGRHSAQTRARSIRLRSFWNVRPWCSWWSTRISRCSRQQARSYKRLSPLRILQHTLLQLATSVHRRRSKRARLRPRLTLMQAMLPCWRHGLPWQRSYASLHLKPDWHTRSIYTESRIRWDCGVATCPSNSSFYVRRIVLIWMN